MGDGGGGGGGGDSGGGDVGSTTHPVADLVPKSQLVGFGMVRGGKAAHPHWRHGQGKKHAKRMYANADTAHAHTKVKP